MSLVVFMDANSATIVESRDQVPAGAALVLASPREMELNFDRRTMDQVRMKILGPGTSESRSAAEAAQLLWDTIATRVPAPKGAVLPRKLVPKKLGIDRSPHELIALDYVPGADEMRDFLFRKLMNQERILVEILLEDGGSVWTKARVDELVLDNRARLNTSQDPLRVLAYYLPRLLEKRFLRRLPFDQFSKEFEGTLS